ncbi:MAG TPA: XRE family transcriptional regulator [Ilumatobacteraceae bacterium]|nr:XRE family transcriptional regulator [Ilumatobacteraceae bacterium]
MSEVPQLVSPTHRDAGPHDHQVDEGALVRQAVAANMRRARMARGLSLREMATQTGLSKALLSQIEREVANPTVAVLTRIAQALDLTFSELTRPTAGAPEIIRFTGTPDSSGARMLFSMMERRRFDLSEGILQPGQPTVSCDHGRGSVEYGYVVSGSVTLQIGEDEFVLDSGDTVRFSSADGHCYRANDAPATLFTVVTYSDE